MAVSAFTSPSPVGRLRRWLAGFGGGTSRAGAIAPRRVNPSDIGRGFADPQHPGMKRIVVTVDAATFERVRALSIANEISLAAAVRLLVERGFAAPARTP